MPIHWPLQSVHLHDIRRPGRWLVASMKQSLINRSRIVNRRSIRLPFDTFSYQIVVLTIYSIFLCWSFCTLAQVGKCTTATNQTTMYRSKNIQIKSFQTSNIYCINNNIRKITDVYLFYSSWNCCRRVFEHKTPETNIMWGDGLMESHIYKALT
jgi:hypothetical protein